MNSRNDHEQAIKEAKSGLRDLRLRGDAAVGGDAVAHISSLLSAEERAASDFRVSIMSELVRARREKGISQKKLEELSGVRQPVIARLEKGRTDPRLETVLRILAPLGKTLAVVPIPGD